MKILKGWNDFYEGWLDRVLLKHGERHHEPPEGKNDVWLLGWKTADESYTVGIGDVLLMEIDKKHILVRDG